MDTPPRYSWDLSPEHQPAHTGGSRKINLILGPGAARGFMHLGALRALLEEGYEIRSLIGSSAGAFIALLYAHTHDIDTVEQLVQGIGFRQLFLQPGAHLTIASLRLNTAAITRYFVELFGRADLTFEELDFPLAFTATNLRTGKVEFLHSGAILPALLASATLPVINPPQYIDDIPYIDGGLTLNMPRYIPAAIKRSEPYLGINVAYGRRFRSNKIDLWRRFFVRALSWRYRLGGDGPTESFQHAHEPLAPIALHEVTIAAPQLNRGDFDKLQLAVQLGFAAAMEQLPPVAISYEPRRGGHAHLQLQPARA